MADALAPPNVTIDSHLEAEERSTIAADVREGLGRELKELSPKYLYDARGSDLFDRITALPEYYPTRCERAILNRHAPEIVRATEVEQLVELGSGTASKTRALLYAMVGSGAPGRYVPFDVDESVVTRAAEELTELYPGLAVHGVVGDFERHLPQIPDGGRRLVALLGGTIGNLFPAPRAAFLADVRELLGADDRLLVGFDLVKDHSVLEAAYNDSEGVTAEFDLNVLRVLNAELGAEFDLDAFRHTAAFFEAESRIEMRLRSLRDQRVSIPGAELEIELAAGEDIRTEISTKFTREGIERELEQAGMGLERLFVEGDDLFAVALARRG